MYIASTDRNLTVRLLFAEAFFSRSVTSERTNMITIETIKTELANIRYYHARKDSFAKAFDSVGQNGIWIP